MERQHLIKEIQYLAERIRANASDADSLLTDVAHLYGMVIMLKHLPEAINTNGQSKPVVSETPPVQKEETKVQPQVAMDLFSSETSSASEQTETTAPKKETPKATSPKKKIDESVAEKVQHNKIDDLKSAIGINEKFQFINELFDGNMKEYTVALDQINNFTTLDEAANYLANLKEVYKWDSENPVAINFQELVERRFF